VIYSFKTDQPKQQK